MTDVDLGGIARLRADDAVYRALFEVIDDGLAVVELIPDADGRTVDLLHVHANPAYERHTGIDGIVGTRASEVGLETGPWHDACTEVARTGMAVRIEAHVGRIDRWLSAHVSRIGSDGSRTLAIVVHDVTDRKHAEATLREHEARYRAVVEASADVVYRMSPDWSRMRSLEGRGFIADTTEPSENWRDVYLVPEDRSAIQRAIDHAIATHSMFALEHRVIRADGTPGWTASRAVPMFDESGAITEWIGTATDVTDRKCADEVLRESEAIRKVAIAGGRMGTWRWDLAARTVEGDERFMALWGFPPTDEALPLAAFSDRMSPDGRAQTETVVTDVVAACGELDDEIEVASGPSAGRWLRWRGRAAPDDSSVIYGVSFDITEQKRAEVALRDSEARLQVLVSELQHRVRNMLTVIRSVFSRTVATGNGAEEMADHFRGRLDALARTQMVTTRNAGGYVDLENLIRDELLSVGVSDGPRVTINGPDVMLPARAAESIGLAIHELATNALKYGAIKVPGATLIVRWAIDVGYGGEPRLTFTWQEQGVPAIAVRPTRRGFGSELIEEALPYRLGADTKLEFLGGGIRCTIDVPLSELDGGGRRVR